LLQSRIVAVPGDGGTNATFALPITTGGSRTFFAVVDGDEAVIERDETNNVASVDLVDPMDTIDVALVPGTLVLSSSSLTAGETLLVEAEVINRGTRRLTAAAVSLFFQDGASFQLASTRSIDLAPGATSRVALSWKANRLGTIALEARADPDGRLSELDETNNLLTASVDVASSTLANLTVSSADVEVQPASPVEGQPASLGARVRNVGSVDARAFEVSFFGGDPEKGGVRLGGVSLPSLGASSDVVVSTSWSDVNLRGTTLLYVVIDEGGAVEEFDEEDNRAFRVVDIVGLSDLTANSAALRLEPAFARSGDAVTIEAVFTNAGEQEASDFVAEVRLDDPLTGTLLASETFGLVGGGQVVSFQAFWDTTGVEGEHALYLALDVLGGVREQREDNNVVRLPVALQDADLFVTPLYFSPDGNGVQDEAAFFYRTDAALLSVDVVDSEGALVRVLSNDAPAAGSAVWDGRNDLGSLARDGEYFFVLSSEAGEVARRRVVLDTNRSSIVEALGSEFVGFTNLTCPLPPRFFLSGPAFLPDDSAAYFIVRSKDSAAPDYPEGLYRVSVDGSLPEPIATGSEFSNLSFFERFFTHIVSPDGRKALALNGDGLQILDLGTGALTSLGRYFHHASWSPDGKRLLVSDGDGVYLYSPNGDLVSTLVAPGAEMAAWSPDGSRIAYRPWQEM
ncbi:MAG TPA: CARDB domain-containing protein, partial [Vicinamibacteria bacterium]|nr:CARDB domain-containing protein [Vicinamibacteria bacterium]